MAKKAVVLFSGGLDSTTCAALAASQGFDVYGLSFSYEQRHSSELAAAGRIANVMNFAAHKTISLNLSELGGSALTDPDIAVPDYVSDEGTPVTYVPARNTVFLSLALGWAEILGAQDIFIGVSHIDYSNYPDCRPEFITAFQALADVATKVGTEGNAPIIHAPLIEMSKAQTVQLGLELGVDYSLTVSCYQADAQGRACGRCDSCALRKRGFEEAGVPDPTSYY